MKKILFIDTTCAAPYSGDDVGSERLDLARCNLSRVAGGLVSLGYEVAVWQSGRKRKKRDRKGVLHLPALSEETFKPCVVVCLNDCQILPWLRQKFERSKLYLWLHDLPENKRLGLGRMLTCQRFQIVAAGRKQARYVRECYGLEPTTVYPPTQPGLERYRLSPKFHDSLLYCGSPETLDETLRLFRALREKFPRLNLRVACHGSECNIGDEPGVALVRGTSRFTLLEEVAKSFCVFQPVQTSSGLLSHGLSFAEANAMGTSVLCHVEDPGVDLLVERDQVVDCSKPQELLNKITQWRLSGPPVPSLDSRLQYRGVLKEWLRILEGDQQSSSSVFPGNPAA
jgi:hypothetical protein